jgi:hypothetical protein
MRACVSRHGSSVGGVAALRRGADEYTPLHIDAAEEPTHPSTWQLAVVARAPRG